MIQQFTSVQAHGRCELTALSLLQNNKLVSTGNDSTVKIWDLQKFKLQLTATLPQSYLTALLPYEKQILVGNGDGEIMVLDSSTFSVNSVRKVHRDCISDIKIFQNRIVSASHDGSIVLIDPANKQTNRHVSVGSPVRQVVRYQSHYYLAGTTKSFELDQELKLCRTSQISRYLQTKGQLYGSNDEKGLICVSKKVNTYVPCENMVEFNNGILGSAGSILTYFTLFPNDELISYSSTHMSGVVKGDSILSMAAKGRQVFAGSQCGKIYSFRVNSEYHWYD